MANRFRRVFEFLLPWWAKDGEGTLVAYSLGVMADAYLERVYQGVQARFPSTAQTDALYQIGQDRLIPQGPLESEANFRARLPAFRQEHQIRGTPDALLEQLHHFDSIDVDVHTVDRRGNKFTLSEHHGPLTYAFESVSWDWDGEPATTFGRFWVWFEADPATGWPWPAHTDTFDSAGLATTFANPSATLTTTAGIDVIRFFQEICKRWKPGGTRCEYVIVSDEALAPDGTWASWRARDDGLYITIQSDNEYPGVRTYPATITMPATGDSPSALILNTPIEELTDRTAQLRVELLTLTSGSGTFDLDADEDFVAADFTIVGGGGGGGLGSGGSGGGGGGAGAIVHARVTNELLFGVAGTQTATIAYSVGVAGTAGTAGNGGAGGASSLTISGIGTWTAPGGSGGVQGSGGGTGGAGGDVTGSAAGGGVGASGGNAGRGYSGPGGGTAGSSGGSGHLGAGASTSNSGKGYGAGGHGGTLVSSGGGGAAGMYADGVGGSSGVDAVGAVGLPGVILVTIWRGAT